MLLRASEWWETERRDVTESNWVLISRHSEQLWEVRAWESVRQCATQLPLQYRFLSDGELLIGRATLEPERMFTVDDLQAYSKV